MNQEQYAQLIAQCVSLSFAEMTKDLERRIAIVLSRHLPRETVINMAQSISRDVTEQIMVNYFGSGRLETLLQKLL